MFRLCREFRSGRVLHDWNEGGGMEWSSELFVGGLLGDASKTGFGSQPAISSAVAGRRWQVLTVRTAGPMTSGMNPAKFLLLILSLRPVSATSAEEHGRIKKKSPTAVIAGFSCFAVWTTANRPDRSRTREAIRRRGGHENLTPTACYAGI
jgi:hypothetical protein